MITFFINDLACLHLYNCITSFPILNCNILKFMSFLTIHTCTIYVNTCSSVWLSPSILIQVMWLRECLIWYLELRITVNRHRIHGSCSMIYWENTLEKLFCVYGLVCQLCNKSEYTWWSWCKAHVFCGSPSDNLPVLWLVTGSSSTNCHSYIVLNIYSCYSLSITKLIVLQTMNEI